MIIRKIVLIASFFLLPLNAQAEGKIISDFTARITALEHKAGGRIGIAALNTSDGQHMEYRANERFALCSTFKFPLAAAILARVDADSESLDHTVEYGPPDMLKYAPVTKKHLQAGRMTVGELAAAAIEYSDNTAANLLLKRVGGPKGLTDYLRSLGDNKTRIDRYEPLLNTNLSKDERDTTTPSSMLIIMQKLLVENALSSQSKEQLITWLLGNTTGNKRLRAGVHADWTVGDKTGTGDNGATNDVAIVWPQGHMPFLISVYYSGSDQPQEKRDAVIAEVGRIVSATFYAP